MSFSKKDIKLMTWNSRGIRNKTGELELLISEYKIDIVLITETYLKPHINAYLPNFACLRRDRLSRPGGGVAIFVKKSIKYALINTNTNNLETVAIQIKHNNKTIIIVAGYNSPGDDLLRSDLDAVFGLGDSVILTGDFNARHIHWGCSGANRSGALLFDYLSASDTVVNFPSSPTHYPCNRRTPSILDIALVRGKLDISEMQCVQALSSDHLPVLFSLEGEVEKVSEIQFDYAKADWKRFKYTVESRLLAERQNYTPYNIKTIDDDIRYLTTIIEEAKTSSIPTRKNHINKIELTPQLIEIIKLKNKLRKQWQKNQSPQLKSVINRVTYYIRDKILEIKNESWTRKLKKLNPADNSLWKITKSFKNKHAEIPPLINGNNMANTNREKSEVLASAFSTSYSLTNNYSNVKIDNQVARAISKIKSTGVDSKSICNVSLTETFSIIKKLKNRKSPGIDRLDNASIKQLPRIAVNYLTNIFNACLTFGYFPSIWKTAKIHPIRKPGKDNSIAINYRPISLLPTLSKIFEKIILSRLKESVGNKIINEQFGFREKHSTTHQLNRLTEHISANFNMKKSTGLLMLDVEKAFDTVWHDGLIYKLHKYKTPNYLINLLRSYLDCRSFVVSVNNEHSLPRNIPAGVPQGSLLGPFLFILYTNDISILKNTSLSMYADDTAIISSSYGLKPISNKLQKSLVTLNNYFNKWKIKINQDKTEAIIFTTRRQPLPSTIKSEHGKCIEWKASVKYLGIHLDSKLKFNKHVTELKSKGLAAIAVLKSIFNRRSALSTKNKILVYKQLIRPVMTYACPVWSNTSNSNFSKLQVVQNKAIKIIYNTPFYTNLKKLHNKYSIPTIKEYVHSHTVNYYKKISRQHTNPLISRIGDYDKNKLKFKYKHKMPKHILL